jgi:hypothetical protein
MKKVLFVFAIATSLVACGGASTETNTTDSTAVDSTLAVDTTVVVDTTAVVDSAK